MTFSLEKYDRKEDIIDFLYICKNPLNYHHHFFHNIDIKIRFK
jgi:hypothetical protein